MVEKTVSESDQVITKAHTSRRFAESVDTTKTPQEEREDPKRIHQGLREADSK